ncbi:hypothetical protein [Stenotrophomonas sp. AB1(2024)]|uniref:hypothetical protein n=1 Tax=Stenotrophomonas sp. AB1(2024) TaxID=3132215 RepID=UPI0030AD0B99
MTKADTIRFLRSERCSASEIALAVGYREKTVKAILDHKQSLYMSRRARTFNSWRGTALSDKVISL